MIGTKASFGVTLGDIMFDDLSLFRPQARNIALLGIPWYEWNLSNPDTLDVIRFYLFYLVQLPEFQLA